MFRSFTQWHWVIFVWLQLLVAYGFYLWYLGRLERQLTHNPTEDNHG
ncbi:MAG: hypothetical protein R2880_10025 [Deinococcales bacterium]